MVDDSTSMSTERPAERSLCNSNRPRPPIARSPPSGPACRIPHRHAGDLGALGKRSGGAAAAPIGGQRGPPRGDGRSVVRPPAARSPAVGRCRDRQRWAVTGLFCNRSAWRSLLHDADRYRRSELRRGDVRSDWWSTAEQRGGGRHIFDASLPRHSHRCLSTLLIIQSICKSLE